MLRVFVLLLCIMLSLYVVDKSILSVVYFEILFSLYSMSFLLSWMFSWKLGLALFIFNVVFKHPFSEDLFMFSFKSFIVLDLKAFSPLIHFELGFVCNLGSFFLNFPFSLLSALFSFLWLFCCCLWKDYFFLLPWHSLEINSWRHFIVIVLSSLFCTLSSVQHYLYPCASVAYFWFLLLCCESRNRDLHCSYHPPPMIVFTILGFFQIHMNFSLLAIF